MIVDADTGYGNALNVQRTVRLFERMTTFNWRIRPCPALRSFAGKTLFDRRDGRQAAHRV